MYAHAYIHVYGGRNKDQKLVGHFLDENQTFYRFLVAVPLKMQSKFGQLKWV